jgi:superfamily II DNA or RNA helicase
MTADQDPHAPQEPVPDWASLRAWEAGLDKGTRARGAEFAAEKKVKLLAVTEDLIAGIVTGSEAMPFRTTLKFNARSGLWSASCDCPVGISCKHAVALARTVLPAEQVTTVAENAPAGAQAAPADFLQSACEALGRDLTRKETLALGNIVAACSPLRNGRPVRASIEAALHALIGNDYATLNRLPGELETSATEPGILLAAIAAALASLGKPVPAWVITVITRTGATDTWEREQHERLVRDWRSTLGGMSFAEMDAPARHDTRDMRLRRVGAWRFSWEIRDNAAAPWRTPGPNEKVEFLKPTFEPETLFTRDSARVADLFRRFSRSATPALAFDIRDLPAGKSFGEMLLQPVMLTHTVDDHGVPLVRHPGRLVWGFAPSPGKPGHARPFLADENGHAASSPIHAIGGGLYLAEDGLHPGPPPLGRYDGRGAPPDIPSTVFEDPGVRAALKAAGARMPASFDITLIPVSPFVIVETVPFGAAGDWALATAKLSGEDAAGRIRATMTEGDWRVFHAPGEPADAVADTTRLESARRHFFTGPRHTGIAGVALLTENTIEAYADWLSGFPAGTRLDLPHELAALVRPPDFALLAADLTVEREGTDWFDLKLVLRPEDAELTKAEIKLLMSHAGKWVRLPDKGWRRMEASVSQAARDALTALGLDPERAALGDSHRFHAAQLAGTKASALFDAVSAADLRERAARLASHDRPPLPAGLRATLRPYQLEGYHFLTHLASNGLGGILADDMGLGKTLQTIAWLLWLKETRDHQTPSKFLVVAPKSVVGNWAAEVEKFAPGLTIALYGVDTATACAKADIVVTNYARLRMATDEFLETEWTAVVLDEGQHIKTPTSQIAECARALRARHRLILSGTPVENRLMDLWSLFAFAMPGLLGTHASFKRQYDEKKDTTAASRLASRVRPFLLRRTKSQVATDLPERIEEDLVVELEPKQRKLYDAEMKKVRAMLLDAKTARDFDKSRFNILASLLRLRQICCDPRLISDKAKPEDSAKLDALWELLEPLLAEGHKVLVFSQFTGVLDLVAERLKSEKVPHLMLTGATENRAELVTRFQKPDTEKIFLLSLKAAGTGLNLTAASYVVLFDPWWNPAAEAQAIDRTHRIGQKNRVIAYRLIAKNTVEEKIRALQRDKAALACEILQEESLSKVLDIDTLRGILAE